MGTSRVSRGFSLGLALMAIASAACVALYWPALHGPLVLDDYPTLGPLLTMSALPADWPYYVMSPSGPLGRPLSMLSFLANLHWSGPKLWAWKATNLGLHCLIGVALWDVSRRLFQLAPRTRRNAGLSAAMLAALWLLHPLQPSTVLYTVQRMTQLSALFTVAGLALYLYGRTQANDGGTARIGMWATYLLCLPLAALSKETGLLLPAYLVVLEATVLDGVGTLALRRRARLLSGLFVVLPVLALLGYFATHFESAVLEPHLKRGFSLCERILTEGRVVVRYLAQIVAPNRHSLGFFHDDIALSTGLSSPPTTLASIALLMTLLGGSYWLRRRLPVVACGILWFFVGHSLESTVIPLELMFEHRNYLPSFAVLLAISGAVHALHKAIFIRRVMVSGAIASLVLCAAVTSATVDDWRDDGRFYAAAYRSHPQSPLAASQLAELLTAQKRYPEAQAIVRALPGTGAAMQRAYIECRKTGKLDSAELNPDVLAKDRVLTFYAAAAITELAKLGLDEQCVIPRETLLTLLLAAATLPTAQPRNAFLMRFYAAHYQWLSGRKADAVASLEVAHRIDPADPMPLFLSSEWLLDMGDARRGRAALDVAIDIAERSGKDYSDLIKNSLEMYRPTQMPPRP